MRDEDKIILTLIGIVFFIGYIGYTIGYSTAENNLDAELTQCKKNNTELARLNKILIEEKEQIKKDVAELFVEYYGKELL